MIKKNKKQQVNCCYTGYKRLGAAEQSNVEIQKATKKQVVVIPAPTVRKQHYIIGTNCPQ